MKKNISIVLVILMFLPQLALADTAATDPVSVEKTEAKTVGGDFSAAEKPPVEKFPTDAPRTRDDSYNTASPWFKLPLIPEGEPQQVSGDWWGFRNKLADKGITVKSSYVFDVIGNPVGGKKKGVCYDHSWGLDINVDMEKLAGFKGTLFHVSGLWRAGRNLSVDKIGNVFNTSSIFGSEEVKFYGLDITQSLFDDVINIKFGRTSAGDDFATSPIYWFYVNNAIDGNPISLPINMPFLTYPNATWGARVRIQLPYDFYTKFGIYNGDPRVGRDSAHGFDFTMKFHRGLLLLNEVGLEIGKDKKSKTLPGNYRFGHFWHTGKFKDQYKDTQGNSYITSGLPQAEVRGNYGFYTHMDQMVYRENGTTDQGLTVFFVTTTAPSSFNQFPFFVDGGVLYKGLIPKRDHDTVGVGFAYGNFSRKLANSQRDNQITNGVDQSPQRYEVAIDFSYKAAITPWLFFQPDIQYIINPGGRKDTKDAVAVGGRMGITF